MSAGTRDEATPAGPTPTRPQDRDTWVKTDSYVRTAMVTLLVGLAVAVFYQTGTQGFLLDSVSAYYYTPAQAIFVGSLIGLAACMIALKGTTELEDIFLNVGGLFAALVAVVPTSRGEDFRTAVLACEEASAALLTRRASTVECPNTAALAEATRANVENNMVALLVMGALALIATLVFAFLDRRPDGHPLAATRAFWFGYAGAVAVWTAALVALTAFERWFIDHGHFIAAAGLFLAIIAVGIVNAIRRDRERGGPTATSKRGLAAAREVLMGSLRRIGGYAWLVWLMVGSAAVLGLLVIFNVVSLFWLEIAVAAQFAVLWMTQTVEQLRQQSPGV